MPNGAPARGGVSRGPSFMGCSPSAGPPAPSAAAACVAAPSACGGGPACANGATAGSAAALPAFPAARQVSSDDPVVVALSHVVNSSLKEAPPAPSDPMPRSCPDPTSPDRSTPPLRPRSERQRPSTRPPRTVLSCRSGAGTSPTRRRATPRYTQTLQGNLNLHEAIDAAE